MAASQNRLALLLRAVLILVLVLAVGLGTVLLLIAVLIVVHESASFPWLLRPQYDRKSGVYASDGGETRRAEN